MSTDSRDAGCPHCGGHDFAVGIHVGLTTTEIGEVGLDYKKEGWLSGGTEPLRADLCTACGTVRRFYVANVNHRWTTR